VPPEPAVSILMLLTRPELARPALSALAAAADPAVPAELLVVLNRCDSAMATVEELAPDARVVRSDANTGTAVAWNLGAQLARAPLLATLHEDAEVHAGWLAPLVAAHAADPALRVCGARLVGPDGELRSDGAILWNDGRTIGVSSAALPGIVKRTEPRTVDHVPAAAMLFDRAAWEEHGGFDERYHPAIFVEVDLCAGVWERGGHVAVVPASVVTHHEGAMLRGDGALTSLELRRHLAERNRERYCGKWPRWVAEHLDGGDLEWGLRWQSPAVPAAVELAARRPLKRSPDPVPVADRRLTGSLADGGLVRESETRWRVGPELRARLLAVEADNHAGFAEELHAELQETRGEVERLRLREATLDAIVAGRWWRLRGALRRLVGLRR
jgi:GT2 family glycosyltransferase